MRRLLALAALLLALAPAAHAHDSLAPDGALHNWLPDEDWVYRHWVPFSERALRARLGLERRQLEAYLMNDHRTLARLARRRGLAPRRLAQELVAPMALVPGADLPVLEERALRILTQGHLAQHLFFHVYHGIDLRTNARETFGFSPDRYYALRNDARLSPRETARRGGRTDDDVRAAMRAAFAQDVDDGLLIAVADPVEQRVMARRRAAQLECWLGRPLPVYDPGHPYGHKYKFHGRHVTGWPATFSERVLDAARVERDLRDLEPACWSPPPVWRHEDRRFRRAVRRHGRHLATTVSFARKRRALVCEVPVA